MTDGVPADWYPDPKGRHQHRYWDGSQWTEQVADQGKQARDPFSAVQAVARSSIDNAADAVPDPKRPASRTIRSPRDAEEIAAAWMRFFGFSDAKATGLGADSGMDVTSARAIAQVKAHMTPIGRPDLQRLHGVSVAKGKMALFFSLMHYTQQAIAWANTVGMALFRFDLQGDPEPVNRAAEEISAAAPGFAPATASNSIWMYAPLVADETVTGVVQKEASPRFRGHDVISWIKQTRSYSMRVDQTFQGRKHRLTQTSHPVVCDSLDGTPIPLNTGGQAATPADADIMVITPRINPADVQREILDLWNRYASLSQPAARQKYAQRLARYSIDPRAQTISVAFASTGIWPVYAALLLRGTSRRIITVEGCNGVRSPHLDRLFTSNLSYVEAELADPRFRRLAASK
jgi:hypothetical protein